MKPNTPYNLAWVPDGAPIPALMVVPLPIGPEKIDQQRYLDLMALRLSDLLEAQDDPEEAARLMIREFDRVGLALGGRANAQPAGVRDGSDRGQPDVGLGQFPRSSGVLR